MITYPGHLYFIKDDFFKRVNEKYLKYNYETTKRPHYFTYRDPNTSLLWVVPCSSKVEKFERIIEDKKAHGKPTDIIKIVKIFDRKHALLFQDMFPILDKYISEPYIKGGQNVAIADPKVIDMLEKNAKKVIGLLKKGIKFTPTQPDVQNIEKLMLIEVLDLEQSKIDLTFSSIKEKTSIREHIKAAKETAAANNKHNPKLLKGMDKSK